MTTRLPLVLVTLLVLVSVGAGLLVATPTRAADANVYVKNVTLSKTNPQAGEPFVVTVTVANSASSSVPITLDQVGIRRGNTFEHSDDLGSLGPGDTTPVPISQTINTSGQHRLTVVIHAKDANNNFVYYEYPVYVTVQPKRTPVSLSIQSAKPTAGEDTPVNVTVANGGETAITDVHLSLSGPATIRNPSRVAAQIPATAEKHYDFTVTFPNAGPSQLTATATYTQSDGTTQTKSTTATVTVEPTDASAGRIQLTGVETSVAGPTVTIKGDAANVGTTDAQSVVISVQPTTGVTPVQPSKDYFVGTVKGGEFGTFELTAHVGNGVTSIPVRAEWTVDGERHHQDVQVAIDANGAPTNGGGFTPGGRPGGPPRRGPFAALGNLDLGLLGLVVLGVLIVLGGGVYLWRR